MISVKRVATGLYVIGLLIAAGIGIERAAREQLLVPLALPAAVILILAARVLRPQAELACWAVFTAWLGSTYLGLNGIPEVVLFVVYLGLAIVGAFKTPYALAAAWLFHPVWDFLPRELPELLVDLPLACVFFDIPIGLYLLRGTRRRRWVALGRAAPGVATAEAGARAGHEGDRA